MKKLLTIFLVIISISVHAQADFCDRCERLYQSKDDHKEYNAKCTQSDSTVLNDSTYEIRKMYKCIQRVTISQFKNKDSTPVFSLEIIEGKDTAYLYTDKFAEFVGGRKGMVKYINKNFVYPPQALRKNIQGKVMVSFFISKTGKVYGTKILKSVETSLDNEALRIIKEMPDWTPTQYKKRPVVSRLSVPISFTLSE